MLIPLSACTRGNDLAGLVDTINECNAIHPGVWTDLEGRQVLRRLAAVAAQLGFRDIVMYLVKTMGVEPHCFPAEGMVYRTEKQKMEDSFLSPLLGALRHEDLALELLALVPRGDACLSETTAKNSDALQLALERGATRVVSELLGTHDVEVDNHSHAGHTALCIATERGDSHEMTLLLRKYNAQGRLHDALTRSCDPNGVCDNCVSYPLLYHVKDVDTAHVLQTFWGAEIPRCKNVRFGRPVHRAAYECNLPLLQFFVERCGLGVDDAGKGNCETPLGYACSNSDTTDARLLPVVEYLLRKGASTNLVSGCKCRPHWKMALMHGYRRVHDHILATHRHRHRQSGEGVEERAQITAASHEISGFEVVEVLSGTGGRRKKPSGKKKKKPRWRKVAEDTGVEMDIGEERGVYEREMREMKNAYERDVAEGDDAVLSDVRERAQEGVQEGGVERAQEAVQEAVQEGGGERVQEAVQEGVEAIGEILGGLDLDDIPELPRRSFPEEFMCPISFVLMTEPVIAMDGHSYEKSAIEAWIATCETKKRQLTSPFTNEPMTNTLIPNLTLRNIIRAEAL